MGLTEKQERWALAYATECADAKKPELEAMRIAGYSERTIASLGATKLTGSLAVMARVKELRGEATDLVPFEMEQSLLRLPRLLDKALQRTEDIIDGRPTRVMVGKGKNAKEKLLYPTPATQMRASQSVLSMTTALLVAAMPKDLRLEVRSVAQILIARGLLPATAIDA